jgi:putative transposase
MTLEVRGRRTGRINRLDFRLEASRDRALHADGLDPVVDLDAAVPKDLVRRRFDAGVLNRVWSSDITYLRTSQGWLYLCAVRDGCSRRVIGRALDEHMHTDLVQAALAMAVAIRSELADEVILHADRGCRCTSAQG